MDFRPVFYIVGILLCILGASMLFPAAIDLQRGSADWKVFLACFLATIFCGGCLMFVNAQRQITINLRQAFLLTTLSWLALSFFGAMPFWLYGMSLTDSFFESVSGITTTGSTVIVGLDHTPPGILLWRAFLQWLGGIGIIVMALSILPFMKVGGMQLFRTESSEKEKAVPRAASLAGSIAVVYIGLTMMCALAYHYSGMSLFDSVAHAMTTLATGGYSTRDASFAAFDNLTSELIGTVFMIMGGLPFVLYLRALHGDILPLFRDSQVRWFLSVILISVSLLVIYLSLTSDMPFVSAAVKATFNTVSIITGTGFASSDFNSWGSFSVGLMLFLMFVGGCVGSTTCGLKIFRFQIMYAVAVTQIRQLLHPHGVFVPQYNGKPVPPDVPLSVASFFFLFAACFIIIALGLSLTGLDLLTSISGAATAISNVGPGLGPIIGPTGTFAPLPASAKWLLCAGMLMGRLELFTVLVLFSPHFWRR